MAATAAALGPGKMAPTATMAIPPKTCSSCCAPSKKTSAKGEVAEAGEEEEEEETEATEVDPQETV